MSNEKIMEIFPDDPNAEEIYPQEIKTRENDVLDIELPPYEENFSHIGDVDNEEPFYEKKQEVYERNIKIAERKFSLERAKKEALENKEKALQREQAIRNYKENNKGPDRKKINMLIGVGVCLLLVIFFIGVTALQSAAPEQPIVEFTTVAINEYMLDNDEDEKLPKVTEGIAEEVMENEEEQSPEITEVIQEEVIEDEEQAPEVSEVTVEEETELDLSPLKAVAGSYVYNTNDISYRFTPSDYVNDYGVDCIRLKVEAKRISDKEKLCVVPSFYLYNSITRIEDRGNVVSFDSATAEYTSPTIYEYSDGTVSGPEQSMVAVYLEGDGTYSMEFDFYVHDEESYDSLRYYPDLNTFPRHTENADQYFELS